MGFFVLSGLFRIQKSIHLPTSNQDRFGAMLGANLGPCWGQVGPQIGSKSVPKPLPTWTFIRCCFLTLLRPSWSRLCEVVGEEGGPFLNDPLMVLMDFFFSKYKLRSSSASGVGCQGLLRLILGRLWEPFLGQVGFKMELFSMFVLTSNFDPSWGAT